MVTGVAAAGLIGKVGSGDASGTVWDSSGGMSVSEGERDWIQTRAPNGGSRPLDGWREISSSTWVGSSSSSWSSSRKFISKSKDDSGGRLSRCSTAAVECPVAPSSSILPSVLELSRTGGFGDAVAVDPGRNKCPASVKVKASLSREGSSTSVIWMVV
eukprot:Gregarina_sp_Pseudo_9__5817@NODE_884_length_2099_cov_5_787864_g830_i0_p2_GENE_NODE_884_length_2099_cov_5_787864_g830_i0NODE_884_length_2099_cov_5_787864_g830_i0_p2_ORF_typecomplete_len158_score39_30_NODE_884_length_2099_cov_5_787864_g830_i015982071